VGTASASASISPLCPVKNSPYPGAKTLERMQDAGDDLLVQCRRHLQPELAARSFGVQPYRAPVSVTDE